MSKRDKSLVYSSDGGRLCEGCEQPVDQCRCGRTTTGSASGGRVRVARETKGRKGKGVTVISGLALDAVALAALAKELKNQCGAGGTIRDGSIEIQGDHRDKVVGLLVAKGFAAKKSGG